VGLVSIDPRWQVEIRPLHEARSIPPPRVHLQPGGQFQFAQISSGSYELVVLDPDQKEVKHEVVTVGSFGSNMVQIRVKDELRTGERPRGPISLKRLAHKTLKPARKEYGRARAERRKEHFELAEAHYRKAIEIDPQFVEAANDLGALLYIRGRYEDSREVLEKAMAVDPDLAPVLANLSAALMALSRPLLAEPLARRAVALDPTAIRSRYLLGLSRAWQNKNDSETEALLEEASPVIPHARLSLARMYSARGDRGSARMELEKYLAAGTATPPAQKTQVEAWLKSLR
jgi:Tfp pilus assembly protein PilF